MESNYNNRDFERFVKQNADQYRMFPSEKVWKGIHSALHTRRRWLGFALALLLISTGVVTGVMLIPGTKQTVTTVIPAKTNAVPGTLENKTANDEVAGPVDVVANPVNQAKRTVAPSVFGSEVFVASTTTNSVESNLVVSATDFENNNDQLVPPATTPAIIEQHPATVVFNKTNPVQPAITNATNNSQPAPIAATTPADELSAEKSKKAEEVKENNRLPIIPERDVNTLKINSGKKKLEWLVYITPTISYRTLTENTPFIDAVRYNNYVNATGGGAGFYSTNINTMVNHKPDLGFQVGVRAAYPVSKFFRFTGGFQLSVSKYDIKAYHHPEEMATIALTDRSVSTMSSFRNTNGYKVNWLRNFYFSASLPVGMELKLSDGTKNYFGIAGTLQPTYVLDNRAYLISADYKNYAEMPSLTRRWNMNASFEIFTAHTTGKVKWQVGPQIRYQTMSSFAKNYPIKEHLFDFGLKLGVQLK